MRPVNIDPREMRAAIRNFGDSIREGEAISLF
jgi:hypothetical protein